MRDSTNDQFDQPRRPARRRRRSRWQRGSSRRFSRSIEPGLAAREPYHGATVLEDLTTAGHDATAVAVILARFAVVQAVLQADAGVSAGAALETDRLIAQAYLSDTTVFRPGEWQALDAALRFSGASPEAALANALVVAGEAAEAWDHRAGAQACYQTAHALALSHSWRAEVDTAARALARIAST